jgi:hypothetical protein
LIAITRLLARQLRAVFRRVGIRRGGSSAAWVVFLAEANLLRVRLAMPNVAVEHQVAGDFPAEQVILPYQFLADCEGSRSDPVVLEAQGKDKTLVRWSDRGVPQMAAYHDKPPANAAEFPALPTNFVPNDAGIWQALHDAAHTADTGRIRYALDALQLRGSRGEIAATDGRQILLQHGYEFPWKGDLLVPASGVLGCRELAFDAQVAVGSTDTWVVLGLGAWSVFLKIDKEARYPKLDDLFRKVGQAPSRLELSVEDSRFLVDALPRLPSIDDRYFPVTVDLNGQAIVRATDGEQTAVTELLLSASKAHGEPVRMNTNRHYLARAAQLGFHDVYLFGPETPAQCDDGRRQYLWAVLDAQSALRPTDNPIRIDSGVAAVPAAEVPPSPPRKRQNTMSRPSTTDTAPVAADQTQPPAASIAPESAGIGNPMVQAEALRNSLRQTLAKTNDLITALKRQRRQSKLVQSTLAALQELRSAG